MKRIALICPGRGSYASAELGVLGRLAATDPKLAALLRRADEHRERIERVPVSDLDALPRFGARHLHGENAAALIYTGSAMEKARLDPELEVVAVCGNSRGWYIALHVAGALDFDEGLRLSDTMGGQQSHGVVGGQLIMPTVSEDWRPDPELKDAVKRSMDNVRGLGLKAYHSIHLGGFEVLAGEDAAVKMLLSELPKRTLGKREYPFQLLGHSAFHTPLLADTSERGKEALYDLPFAPPEVPLIDGRGHTFSPLATDPGELAEYTLGHQVVEAYDFSASVRVVLREYAPDALVLLGPGDALGSSIAQVLISEGWRGVRDREDFLNRQRSEAPLLYATAREEQRLRLRAS